jgi:hypothetical protein
MRDRLFGMVAVGLGRDLEAPRQSPSRGRHMRNAWLLPLTVVVIAALASCGGDAGTGPSDGDPRTDPSERTFQPLEFPFADPGVIVRMVAWGIPNWSGSAPHNGIDFQVDGRRASTTITSPAAGEVRSVSSSENSFSQPPGQLLLTIAIRVNQEWTVNLVIEPSTTDPALKNAQLAAVRVRAGQNVSVGSPVADLLVGTLGYPHLHYMVERGNVDVCAYAHSSEAAKRTIEAIARYPNSTVPGGQVCVGQS